MKARVNISTDKRLAYARGYIALGMIKDAEAELNAIEESERGLLDEQRVRVDLHMEAKRWARVAVVAEAVVEFLPEDEQVWISWAYALRELQRVEKAQAVLLRAEEEHGHKSAILHYNLACYACLLNDLEEANRRLKRAIKLDKRFEEEWARDPDLKDLLGVF